MGAFEERCRRLYDARLTECVVAASSSRARRCCSRRPENTAETEMRRASCCSILPAPKHGRDRDAPRPRCSVSPAQTLDLAERGRATSKCDRTCGEPSRATPRSCVGPPFAGTSRRRTRGWPSARRRCCARAPTPRLSARGSRRGCGGSSLRGRWRADYQRDVQRRYQATVAEVEARYMSEISTLLREVYLSRMIISPTTIPRLARSDCPDAAARGTG